MSFTDLLENLQKHKRLNVLTDTDRNVLYDFVGTMSSSEASNLYKDLCYLYVCVVNDNAPDKNKLSVLQDTYSNSFIRSMVDIGSLVDKLADASYMDSETRKQKWKCKNVQVSQAAREHKQNAVLNAQWSTFLYESRMKNELAYKKFKKKNVLKQNKKEKKTKKANKVWNEILEMDNAELKAKSPAFYQMLQTNSLSTDQKRALLHKLAEVFNFLPNFMREKIQILSQEVFAEELHSTTFKNSCCVVS